MGGRISDKLRHDDTGTCVVVNPLMPGRPKSVAVKEVARTLVRPTTTLVGAGSRMAGASGVPVVGPAPGQAPPLGGGRRGKAGTIAASLGGTSKAMGYLAARPTRGRGSLTLTTSRPPSPTHGAPPATRAKGTSGVDGTAGPGVAIGLASPILVATPTLRPSFRRLRRGPAQGGTSFATSGTRSA